jgi:hypothetical protein
MADRMVFFRTSLIGGAAGSLDSIDGTDRGDTNALQDGDIAFTIDTAELYCHVLDDDSAAAENSPLVIKPDTNAGDMRWIQQGLPTEIIKDQFPQAITDNHVVTVDSADAATGEYAKFTANGLESKSLAEVKADLGIDYETIWIPANTMTPTATNGAAAGTKEYATNDINMDYLAFDGATEEFAEFQLPMPENWDRSTIKAKLFWSSAAGSTTADTVEWEIQAGALSNDDAIDAALETAQVISDALLADAGADLQISGATPAITVGGTPALGDLIHFKVSRNVGGTDDMTEDAWLFGVWIQYKCTNVVAAW